MQIKLENTGNKVQDPQDIYEIIQRVFYQKKGEVDLHKEHFWVLCLNKSLKILALELVGIGSKDRVIADPGDVFRLPLYKSSSYVVLAHNHPSGSLKPSDSDMELTNRLMKAGDILDVKVIEHVIVTDKSYFSFHNNGLIDKLEMDTSYALSFIYEKKMTRKMEALKKEVEKQKKAIRLEGKKEGIQEGKKLGEARGIEKGKKEIARNLIAQGVDLKIIQASTELSAQQIVRLKNQIKQLTNNH